MHITNGRSWLAFSVLALNLTKPAQRERNDLIDMNSVDGARAPSRAWS